ncbi:hypothetical protein ACPV5O_26275 [Vibrio maritimus]|uniref:hypothetical protein n=1 Tax=Vibrio maritimus TaxID=990268 RepID=UPI004067649D
MQIQQQHGIKISFKPNTHNSSRVFYAMGGLLDGFSEAQQVVLDSINLGLVVESKLKRTKEGSCICIEEKTIFLKDTRDVDVKRGLLDELTDLFLDWFGRPESIDDRQPLEELAKKAESCIANNITLKNKKSFNVGNVSTYSLAKALEKISASVGLLSEDDMVSLGHSKDAENPTLIVSKERRFTRTVDDIFADTDNFPHTKVCLEICTAALSGNIWKVKWLDKDLSKKPFSVVITHDEWIEEWLNRKVHLHPGDGLVVDITVFRKKAGKLKKAEISRVYRVVKNIVRYKQSSLIDDSNDGAKDWEALDNSFDVYAAPGSNVDLYYPLDNIDLGISQLEVSGLPSGTSVISSALDNGDGTYTVPGQLSKPITISVSSKFEGEASIVIKGVDELDSPIMGSEYTFSIAVADEYGEMSYSTETEIPEMEFYTTEIATFDDADFEEDMLKTERGDDDDLLTEENN